MRTIMFEEKEIKDNPYKILYGSNGEEYIITIKKKESDDTRRGHRLETVVFNESNLIKGQK